MNRYFFVVLLILLLAAAAFVFPLFKSGQRVMGTLESIHGIPFPQTASGVEITEALAHADIFLQEPVVGKKLTLTISFEPKDLKKLSLGIRDNSFWLSYTPITIYDASVDQKSVITKKITIPLTDKLQDTNGSVDLMFFADDAKETNNIDQSTQDKTLWYVHSLTANVKPVLPTKAELKDYSKSIIYQEKAL